MLNTARSVPGPAPIAPLGEPFYKKEQIFRPDDSHVPVLVFATSKGKLFRGDAIAWMQSLPSASVDLIFADPPYNIKKAEWDNFASHQAYVDWSTVWIAPGRPFNAAGRRNDRVAEGKTGS